MHGARGLLISITGGPDLTLYEVDEAASRIREEVDADANIILGATFDPNMTRHHPRRGRRDRHRCHHGPGARAGGHQGEPRPGAVAGCPPSAAPSNSRQAAPAPQCAVSAPVPRIGPDSAVRSRRPPGRRRSDQPAGTRALYYQQDEGVTVEPYIPGGTPDHLEEPLRAAEPPVPSAYVPSPRASAGVTAAWPRTEELPAVARKTLVAEERHEAGAPKCPRAVQAAGIQCGSSGCARSTIRGSMRPATRPQTMPPRVPQLRPEAARNSGNSAPAEGARGLLDQHGRPMPAKEHIEIPSFLRKHGYRHAYGISPQPARFRAGLFLVRLEAGKGVGVSPYGQNLSAAPAHPWRCARIQWLRRALCAARDPDDRTGRGRHRFKIQRKFEDGSIVGPVSVHFARVTRTTLCTTIDLGDSVSVATVEHVISALSGLGVDNALLTVTRSRMPDPRWQRRPLCRGRDACRP